MSTGTRNATVTNAMDTPGPCGSTADAVSEAEVGDDSAQSGGAVAVSRLDSLKAWTVEYKGKLAAVPTRWKVVWVLGLAVWAPLA